MPTKKLRDLSRNEVCFNPGHNPPQHMVYSDGVWEHVCPGCGHRQVFTIRSPR